MTTASPAPSSALVSPPRSLRSMTSLSKTSSTTTRPSPRWNWRELRAARIVKRRFEREVILLGIEIDIALERETRNMEWLGSLSQEELRARIYLAWRQSTPSRLVRHGRKDEEEDDNDDEEEPLLPSIHAPVTGLPPGRSHQSAVKRQQDTAEYWRMSVTDIMQWKEKLLPQATRKREDSMKKVASARDSAILATLCQWG
ncbi:hypothetical protein BKA58DRAFT_397535 [Alternaria rosae]|uniref:uncharacterized protein n=1 Tax=Alternaria rosae TaxID=1187941 RepID=UPI001E8C9E2C|nr:uncharacterized protein BKA58DRAFT_397535 [Alternaria rosae]KAH6883337.1 hypothetical protein BKA58DRAFT_397535 [Alternaria rosae]